MEALKKYPYPSKAPDISIFEDQTDEYITVARDSPVRSLNEVPRTSVQTLRHLVKRGDYSAAERLRNELLQLGVEIPLDSRYEQAAIAVLRLPDCENRATAFSNWFSLVPMAYNSKPRSFHTICQLLFYISLQPDLQLVLRFGLLCASKGYARKIFRRVVPFVVRFADPSVSAVFMDEFERLAVRYLRKRYPKEIRKMLQSFYSLVVRTHCLAGRPNEAIRIFQATRDRNIPVSHFSASLLVQTLERNLDAANIALIKDLLRHHRPLYFPPERIAARQGVRTNTPWLSTLSLPQTTRLALQLQILKRSILSDHPPTAHAIVDFMNEYHFTGRNRGLVLLRKKIFRHSHRSISLWSMAEMVYHLQKKHYDMIVVVFAAHFHLVGVPHDPIVRQLEQPSTQKKVRFRQRELTSNIIPGRYPMTQRVFPSSTHTALLWQALVYLSRGEEELETLYRQLLHFAHLSHHGTVLVSSHNVTSLSAIPPPAQVIDDTHFTPFIRAFRRRCGAYRAIALFQDMLNLGIHPNHYQYATLAGEFARAGEVDKTMRILGEIESNDPVSPADLCGSVPYSDIVTYTNILRGFIDSECLDAAVDIDERIMKKLGYVPGSNPLTDHTRSLLRSVLQEKSTPPV